VGYRLRGLVDALHSMLESGAVDLHGGRIDGVSARPNLAVDWFVLALADGRFVIV